MRYLAPGTPTTTLSPTPTDTRAAVLNGSVESALGLTKLAYSLREFCDVVGIGRSLAYSEISAGHLVAVRCGRRTLIRAADAQHWLANLPEGAADEPAAPRRARIVRKRVDGPHSADCDAVAHLSVSTPIVGSGASKGVGGRRHRVALLRAASAAEVSSS